MTSPTPSEAEARELIERLRQRVYDHRFSVDNSGTWPVPIRSSELESLLALATLPPQDRSGDVRGLLQKIRLIREVTKNDDPLKNFRIRIGLLWQIFEAAEAALSQDSSEGVRELREKMRLVEMMYGVPPAALVVFEEALAALGSQHRSLEISPPVDAAIRAAHLRSTEVIERLPSQHRSPPDGMVPVPREVLVASKAGLRVLADLCDHARLPLGKAKAAEIEDWINEALSAAPSAPPEERGA